MRDHRRLHQARQDAVDANMIGRELHGGGLGHLVHRRFGRAIRRTWAPAAIACHRTDAADHAAPGRLKVARRAVQPSHRADDVDRNHVLIFGRIEFIWIDVGHHARGVHDRVHTAQTVLQCVPRSLRSCDVGGVRDLNFRVATFLADRGRDLSKLRCAPRHQSQLALRTCQFQRERPADA